MRVGPGATVRQVNARLGQLGRKLGPDPASEIACTLGGVVANNSSGMACGTIANTYNTLDSLVLVLPSGTVIDTGADDADERLLALEPVLYQGLARLRDRVRSNPASVRIIEQQFSMKNTMGYGLNSLLDHTRPVDILAHLVVGSEGTLAFIASVVMRTVPLLQARDDRSAGLRDPQRGNGFTAGLGGDRTCHHRTARRRIAAGRAGGPAGRRKSAANHRGPARRVAGRVPGRLGRRGCRPQRRRAPGAELATGDRPGGAHRRPRARARLWHTRKGLYATVAEARPSGSTALLEDIVVPVPALLDTCEQLTSLVARHGYDESVIFGHAKDGNIHFMLTEQLGGGGTARPLRRIHRRHGRTRAGTGRFTSRPSTAPAG